MAIGGFLKELISPVTDLIGKAVVDKDRVREINLEIEKIADRADERLHEQLLGQLEINKTEAQHASIFVAGWRPFIGWTSGVGLAYTFVLKPFLEFGASVAGYAGQFPDVDTGTLFALITAMLGVGAQRSFDKMKGTDTKKVGKVKNND